MNRAKGYSQIIVPGEATEEIETFTCAHCNRIVRMQKDVTLQGLAMAIRQGKEKRDIRRCHSCDALICPTCIGVPQCQPFEKQLRAYEQRERLILAVG
jgi:hypothetical protein